MAEKIEISTLETIDLGFYDFIDNNFDLHTTTNKGLIKVPVLWLSAERTFQIKNDRSFRDSVGKLRLPLISIERTEITKDKSFKGSVQADIPIVKNQFDSYKQRPFYYKEKILQEKTIPYSIRRGRDLTKGQQSFPDDKFKTISKKKIVKQSYFVPLPVYVTINYAITIKTEYQQQMNDLLQPFVTVTGQINSFVFEKDGHRYEAFIQQDFTTNNNTTNIGEDERMFETKIQIKVLGYFVGEGFSRNKPLLARRENQVRIRFGSERSVVGDKIPWKNKDNDYKE